MLVMRIYTGKTNGKIILWYLGSPVMTPQTKTWTTKLVLHLFFRESVFSSIMFLVTSTINQLVVSH